MRKHINFLGYTFWIADDRDQTSSRTEFPGVFFYSPSVLAAYSIFTNFSVGILLYSRNLSRRGYFWRGRVLAILSVLFLVFRVFQGLFVASTRFTEYRSEFLLDVLVAAILYGSEKPHFDRAVRNGSKPARWWLPLVWITAIVATQFLVYFLLQRLVP
jgi:hypothetical protein